MSRTLAPVLSLFLGVAFLLCGNGLQTTLMPLRAEIEGFSAIEIGLMGSGYYAGFVAGCLAGPYLIMRAGHIRAFAALAAAASAVALAHPLLIDPLVWIGARMLTGFSLAGFYLIVESWLNDRATNENRGLVMSAYLIVTLVTITVGQLLVITAPVQSFVLFTIASILVSLAVIPVVLTSTAEPSPITIVEFRPLRLYKIAPVGLVGSLMIGVANGSFWSLGTLYATGRGLGENGAAIFMSLAVIGGAVMQWPVGWLSDHFDRRVVLAGVMAASASMALLLALLPLGEIGLYIVVTFFGMATLTGYSVAAAHAYDRASSSSYVEMAAGILLANGIGASLGPFPASALIERFGPSSLFVFMSAVQVIMMIFIILRTRIRPAPEQAAKETFNLYSAVAVGPVLGREGFEESEALERKKSEWPDERAGI